MLGTEDEVLVTDTLGPGVCGYHTARQKGAGSALQTQRECQMI